MTFPRQLLRLTAQCLVVLIGMTSSYQLLAIKIGEQAAPFTLQGHNGTYSLADYKDKTVVLEWYNDDCPFVDRHYNIGNMQKLQSMAKEKGIAWFSVISSKEGKQGYLAGAKQAMEKIKARNSQQTAILFDRDGKVGKAYDAKKTPEMYIIHKNKLVFAGGIDGLKEVNSKVALPAEEKQFFKNALLAAANNKAGAIDPNSPVAYGCSVKY